jgi:hypothetical protein
VRTDLIFFLNVNTITWCQNFRNCFGENRIQWVSYFVKIKPGGYHKIMIPAQQWSKWLDTLTSSFLLPIPEIVFVKNPNAIFYYVWFLAIILSLDTINESYSENPINKN